MAINTWSPIMQLYALDSRQQLISSKNAVKHQDYFCLECQSIIRLRGGMHRQNHFYHTQPNRSCRLSGKSMTHIQAQCFIQNLLPAGEAFLEMRFPEINRVADVVWTNQKIIFEIQCSPITAGEVEARNGDYQRLGYHVVWILHDSRYNQWRMTAAEMFLRDCPHYFTNLDTEGKGTIYDQFDVVHKGLRKKALSPLNVDLGSPQNFASQQKRDLPQYIESRLMKWPFCFSGNLIDSCLQSEKLLMEMLKCELEHQYQITSPRSWLGCLKASLYYLIVRPYKLVFQILLERACR